MISIHFDSIIYSLQKFGGASVYFKNIVDHVKESNHFKVLVTDAHSFYRGIPLSSRADVFHSSHFRSTIFSRSKTVTTVHDDI